MKLICIFCALTVTSEMLATTADDDFQKLANAYIENLLRSNPEQATELGDHRFDTKLTDYSADARAKELAEARSFLAKLNDFKGASNLTGPNSVDFRILKDNVYVRELMGL